MAGAFERSLWDDSTLHSNQEHLQLQPSAPPPQQRPQEDEEVVITYVKNASPIYIILDDSSEEDEPSKAPFYLQQQQQQQATINQSKCCICWEDFQPQDLRLTCTERRCQEACHFPCVSHWKAESKSHLCVVCRKGTYDAAVLNSLFS